MELKDSVSWVAKIIEDLPEQQKLIIQLRDIEDYDFDEIAKILDMNNPLTEEAVKSNVNYKWLAVAAVALLMLGFYFGSSSKQDLGTYEDPQLALNAFSKSMEMISTKFNKGAATVGYLNEVNKGTSTLGYLNEIENTTRIIFKK